MHKKYADNYDAISHLCRHNYLHKKYADNYDGKDMKCQKWVAMMWIT